MGRRTRQGIGELLITTAVTLAVADTAVAAAAPSGAERAAQGKRAAVKPFNSCDHLRSHYRAHPGALRRVELDDLALADAAEAVAPGTSTPDAAGGGAPPAAASTNVQEAGVDEPDLVKAQGSRILAIADGRLYAVDAVESEPRVLGSLELPDGPGGDPYAEPELLVYGERALIISDASSPYGADQFATATLLTEVAIADPAGMEVLQTELVEGTYVSARLTGSTARVVLSTPPPLRVAERGNGRALVPRVRTRDRVAGTRSAGKLVGCEGVRRPAHFAGADLLTVLTVDLEAGLPAVDADTVMTAGEVVYASPTGLYVATERWLPEEAAAQELSQVSTAVHRFDTSLPGATEYVASGKVPGFMLSQWSMSEHEGVLRVASTTVPPWRDGADVGRSQSFLTALAIDGERLREVGQVDGLGEGEQIYAVRMIGDLGYVVTFRQVDPLYVLDLADATRPRVLGELKIPGYSAYLHPVGDGHLLGVGQDATERGGTLGVQVSLFDVRDPVNPVRLDRESFGRYSHSEIEYDHHAFSYFPAHGLTLVPIDKYAMGNEFQGAAGLRIDPLGADPIRRIAMVSHGDAYEARIRRSLLVGDRVYTFSAAGLAAHDAAILGQVGFVPFAGD